MFFKPQAHEKMSIKEVTSPKERNLLKNCSENFPTTRKSFSSHDEFNKIENLKRKKKTFEENMSNNKRLRSINAINQQI